MINCTKNKKNYNRCCYEYMLDNGVIRRCKQPIGKDCKYLCESHYHSAETGAIQEYKVDSIMRKFFSKILDE